MEFEKLNNTRDLGTVTGNEKIKIRSGRLFRSGHLKDASENDIKKLSGMVDIIIDLRTEQESSRKPDPEIVGVKYKRISILDSLTAGVTREEESDRDVFLRLANDAFDSKKYMCGIYESFVADEKVVRQYSEFAGLIYDNKDKSVLWHCTAGKDRAGFATVIVCEILGIDRDDIIKDYLLTNKNIASEVEYLKRMVHDKMHVNGKETDTALENMFQAKEEYLNAAYKKTDELYGGFGNYIKNGLNISDQKREEIKKAFLE